MYGGMCVWWFIWYLSLMLQISLLSVGCWSIEPLLFSSSYLNKGLILYWFRNLTLPLSFYLWRTEYYSLSDCQPVSFHEHSIHEGEKSNSLHFHNCGILGSSGDGYWAYILNLWIQHRFKHLRVDTPYGLPQRNWRWNVVDVRDFAPHNCIEVKLRPLEVHV